MNAAQLFANPGWHRLGLVLAHFLWQGSIIALLAGVTAVFLRRGQARYVAYLAGLALMAICPVATFWIIDVPEQVAQARPMFVGSPTLLPLSVETAHDVPSPTDAGCHGHTSRQSVSFAQQLPPAWVAMPQTALPRQPPPRPTS